MTKWLRTWCLSPFTLALMSTPASAQLIISEFRVHGANTSDTNEYIEIYNNSGRHHTVAAISGTGYGIAASDDVTRCTIPNGTVIPAHGHFLCANSTGYSLNGYPAGNGTTASFDASYILDIPRNAGIALFRTNVVADYTLANRLDAAGSTSEVKPLYREAAGYPSLAIVTTQNLTFYRDACGKQGSITTLGDCPSDGALIDTDNNASDFVFADTAGTSAGAGQRLGAPGPENLSSPTVSSEISTDLLDPCVAATSAPNQLRDLTPDPPNNSSAGFIEFRRTFTNRTGGNVTRLRFRVIDLTTFPAPVGFADLRARTSVSIAVTVDRPPCGSGTSNIAVQGTTVETPPAQIYGGGFNSSLSLGTVSLATPLPNGQSRDLRFLFGVQQTGNFKLGLLIEALPALESDRLFRHGFEASYVEMSGGTG